jgi:NADPH:quinone reductase-like Zn-dependent oxidoreductase
MRAIFLERLGAPEVLVERQIEPPPVAPEEVQIEVMAAGVNFADILQRLGLYGSGPRLPYIPGFEVAGVVRETGSAVEKLKTGDRVVGLTKSGGYAERICLPSESVKRLPRGFSFQKAAALPVNYLTAWFCLFPMGTLQPGDRLLIHGGTGGVGIAAVQLAQELAVKIFATVGSEHKKEYLERCGLKHAINYKSTDFIEYVRQHTDGQGVELVLDGVGGRNLRRSYEILAPMGRLISFGLSAAAPTKRKSWSRVLAAWWQTPWFRPLDMIGRNVGVFGFHLALLGSKQWMIQDAFKTLIDKVEGGILKPVISAEFPLCGEGAIQAHHYLHERRNIGKVLLIRQGDCQ